MHRLVIMWKTTECAARGVLIVHAGGQEGAAFHPPTAEETQKRPGRQIRVDLKAFPSFGCANERNGGGIYIGGGGVRGWQGRGVVLEDGVMKGLFNPVSR